MISQKNVLRLVDFGGKNSRASSVGMKLEHKAPMSRSDFGDVSIPPKPKDLVGLLLGYGARTRRASLPRVTVNMEVFTPAGQHAVQISFKKT